MSDTRFVASVLYPSDFGSASEQAFAHALATRERWGLLEPGSVIDQVVRDATRPVLAVPVY